MSSKVAGRFRQSVDSTEPRLTGSRFVGVAGLQEAVSDRASRMGQQRAGGDACEYRGEVAGVLGRRNPRSRLRLGSDRPGDGGYSKHPVVRKANEANATMGVGEFLTHVRRMVVDYIVGQVLSGERGADLSAADRLDEVTAYYLLHRHDFGMDEAPVGACILYATACGLSDGELDKTWDVLIHVGSDAARAAETEEALDDSGEGDGEPSGDDSGSDDSGGGSKVKLKPWNQRRGKSLGHEAPQGKAVPLIDRIHRVMHLWKDGDLHKVDEYLDQHALRRHELFKRVVQSLIELSTNSERSFWRASATTSAQRRQADETSRCRAWRSRWKARRSDGQTPQID